MGRIEVNEERCKGCELCVTFCPLHVIALAETTNSKGYHPATLVTTSGRTCTGCAICARMCPDVVITVYR